MRRVLILIIAMFLAGCQSSWLTDLAVMPGEKIYWDDFSDPGSGWLDLASDQGELGYAAGSYRMLVTAPRYDLWAVTGQTFGDVQVEVSAAPVAGPEQNRFGLVCRYQDPGNYYFFVISSDGYYTVGRLYDGVRSLLGQEMMAYSRAILPGQAVNRLRFDCIGQALTGYINGQMVAVTTDGEFRSGDAGLLAGSFETGGVEIHFDDFAVIQP